MRAQILILAGGLIASTGVPLAAADVAAPSRATVPPTLASEFSLITRECKQAFAEIGSAHEKPDIDLVNTTSAAGYASVCKDTGGTYRCLTSLLDKNQTFANEGTDSLQEEFLQVGRERSFIFLQAIGGSSMYINPASHDAVIISRQYVDVSTENDRNFFIAFSKVCKALYLTKAERAYLEAQQRGKTSKTSPSGAK